MSRAEFNELVHELSRKLYGYAFRILGNQEEAEDAVQEIFIKLWKMGDKLQEYNSIEALATTMTKNFCIDQVRKRKRTPVEVISNREFRISSDASPLEEIENKESNEILHKIIETLPEAFQSIIVYRHIDDFSYEEIAEKTGQSVNTLRVTLSRARKMIRDEYNKYHYESGGIKPITR